MTGLSVLLAYAGWAAAPLVAYAALSHGLRRAGRGFLVLLAGYSALVWLTWAALRAGTAAASVAPVAVLVPWAGVAVLSLLLYALGAWIGGGE
ncbi:hypothetical protein [Rhodovulum euryhalinum]|uniref:Uncharacterized protein n=1 Tax=Rhodovulum euryhalinum TaxID=35805 RepID=A0A4R2KGR0_9RHOB|nr:hypothetical protein [Rhodovulum euryhalinum]TCO72941.1 hypothetical protein EV655_103170 [Rhodovulum euryhalinum]